MTKPTPNPNTNKLLSLLVFLFFAAVVTIIVLAAANRHMLARYGEDQGTIKRGIKRSEHREDSLVQLIKKSQARIVGLEQYVERQEELRAEDRAATNKWKKQYQQGTVKPIKKYSDIQLDSLLKSLY